MSKQQSVAGKLESMWHPGGWRRLRRVAAVIGLGWMLPGWAAAGGVPATPGETMHAVTRGFGVVDVTLRRLGANHEASWTTFRAEDAAHARI